MGQIYNSIDELVGRTPLLRLKNIETKFKLKAHLFGKCECYNPAFSIKDRVAKHMLENAKKNITKDTVFVEATSGNTGIGLAALCASKGYKLVIIMPENMTKERISLMRHFGAEVILTPKEDGMKGACQKAEILKKKNKNVILLNQFENKANPEAHSLTTATEILDDLNGNVDAVVAGVGTSGTLTGISRTLKTCNPDLYVVAVEPKSSPVLEGKPSGAHQIPGIGANFIPPFYEPSLVNEIMDISDEEAFEGAQISASLEGLAIGISAGASLKAGLTLAKRPEMKGKNIVVIFADSIERYLSMTYFNDKEINERL